MKFVIGLVGLVGLLLCEGREIEAPYGGAYGVYGEYPYTSYGYYGTAPGCDYYPYRSYHHPYDRDHYWDRDRHWERHRYPYGEHHRDWD
jgi:hypothetical protein